MMYWDGWDAGWRCGALIGVLCLSAACTCQYKAFVIPDSLPQLSEPLDLGDLAHAIQDDSTLELTCPDANTLRISRMYGRIEYDLTVVNQIENGETVSRFWFNAHGSFRRDGESCSTPDTAMDERMFALILALPLTTTQALELSRAVRVTPARWMAADEAYWEPDGSCAVLLAPE